MAVMTTYSFCDIPLEERRRPCSACCAMRRRLADALWYFCVVLCMDGVGRAFSWLFDTTPHSTPQFMPMLDGGLLATGGLPATASNQSEQPRRTPSAPAYPADGDEIPPPVPRRDYKVYTVKGSNVEVVIGAWCPDTMSQDYALTFTV